ncbi:hypothetical protein XGA_1546 [Xanthomonas hortorum ATCC 19865]|nr:hypothetical protein XGA_1546 [Xanthomonas hortorum ATCC 19865]
MEDMREIGRAGDEDRRGINADNADHSSLLMFACQALFAFSMQQKATS